MPKKTNDAPTDTTKLSEKAKLAEKAKLICDLQAQAHRELGKLHSDYAFNRYVNICIALYVLDHEGR